MKRLWITAAILSMSAMSAAAQDTAVGTYTFRTNTVTGSVMGTAVKGAPYSADEITESLQVLADGTRISHQNQVTVYRDGEGRVRRDSPSEITISDPVANVSYSLNPKTMTARKSTQGQIVTFYSSAAPLAKTTTSTVTTSAVTVAKQQAEAQALAMADLAKLQAELAASQNGAVVVNGSPADEQKARAIKEKLDIATLKLSKANTSNSSKVEALGQQVMEGVAADGSRTTTIMEVGAIGNDRPIQVVSERWYSAELQTVVMTKRTDPRTGEETFHLANVHRGEPGADLFLVPPGYQLVDTATKQVQVKKEE